MWPARAWKSYSTEIILIQGMDKYNDMNVGIFVENDINFPSRGIN